MQWDKSVNAGFSDAPAEKLYIPLDSAADRPDAASQLADESSLRSEVRRLISLRLQNKALQSHAEIAFVQEGYPLVYTRKCDTQQITVILNPAAKGAVVENVSGKLLYTVGGEVTLKNGKCVIGGCSAGFVEN